MTMASYLFVSSIFSTFHDVWYLQQMDEGTDFVTRSLVPNLEAFKEDPEVAAIADLVSIPDDQPKANSIWIKLDDGGNCNNVDITVTFICDHESDSIVDGGCTDQEKYRTSVSLKPDCDTTRELPDNTTGSPITFVKVATFDGYTGNYVDSNPNYDVSRIRLENNFIGSYNIQASENVYSVWEWEGTLVPDVFDAILFRSLLGSMFITCICLCCTGGIYFYSGPTHTSMPAAMPNVQMQQQPMQQPMAYPMQQQAMQQPMAYPMVQQPMQQQQY